MKRGLLTVLGAIVLCLSGRIAAQGATILNVGLNTNVVDEDIRLNVAALLDRVEANLQEYDVALNISDSLNESQPDMEITVTNSAYSTFPGTHLYLKSNTSPLLEISRILYSQFDQPAEIPILWDELDRIDATLDLISAISLYSADKCDPAEGFLETMNIDVIGTANTISYTNFYRGNCALIAGNYETAVRNFNAGLWWADSVPAYSAPIVNLTWILIEQGSSLSFPDRKNDPLFIDDPDFGLSRIVCAEDCTEDKITDILGRRAQLYALDFRYDDAIADMDAAIELAPDNPELYVLRGQIILLLYEWDRVLADYNHAIELDPNYADAYYYRGILFYTLAHREEALPDFQHYLELAPDGDHASDAAQYIADIQRELDTLTEP